MPSQYIYHLHNRYNQHTLWYINFGLSMNALTDHLNNKKREQVGKINNNNNNNPK